MMICKENYKTIYKGLFTLCSYLKTKESYDRWVTRRVWGFRHQISKAKKKNLKISVANISRTYPEASGEHRGTVQKNSPGKRYQRIQTCLTREVEMPSSPIRRQTLDVRYPEKVEHRKGARLRVQGVGTPPPDDTEHASLSGATPSGFPKRTRGTLPYPDSLRKKHMTFAIITPRTIAYPIQICCLDH